MFWDSCGRGFKREPTKSSWIESQDIARFFAGVQAAVMLNSTGNP